MLISTCVIPVVSDDFKAYDPCCRNRAQEHGLAEREGVEMRVVGDLSLAPAGVQGAAARMMDSTSRLRNKRALLNICFSYT